MPLLKQPEKIFLVQIYMTHDQVCSLSLCLIDSQGNVPALLAPTAQYTYKNKAKYQVIFTLTMKYRRKSQVSYQTIVFVGVSRRRKFEHSHVSL